MPIAPQTLVHINPGSTLDQWPVGYHYGNSKDVILLQQDTTMWVLSDILVLPPPFPWPAAFSVGDLVIALGIVVLLQGPVYIPVSGRQDLGLKERTDLNAHLSKSREGTENESQEP
jgi:hypothetical protein